MRILILEDEPLMANDLASEILQADPTNEIIGKFGSIEDASIYLEKNDLPDLFFSDIQLSDGLSFELFQRINTTVPVIFCTAFDQYALTAFKANGIDYLLKPFDSIAIGKALERYRNLTGYRSLDSSSFSELIKSIHQIKDQDSRSLIVHQGQKMYAIKHADLRMAYVKNGITYIITNEEKKHIVNYSLDSLESLFPSMFYRANRQVLIHRDAIHHISTYFARKLLIQSKFKIDFDITVSKANASGFMQWLTS